jgi:holo-[acyl-carrier protein] synthase
VDTFVFIGKNMKIGIDIEEVKRFSKLIKNKAFLKRVFSKEEIDYCKSKKQSAQHFAVRFAAKEAVWKAVNRKKNVVITDIFIKNEDSGKPQVFIKNRKAPHIDVSLSHTGDIVVAVAVSSK